MHNNVRGTFVSTNTRLVPIRLFCYNNTKKYSRTQEWLEDDVESEEIVNSGGTMRVTVNFCSYYLCTCTTSFSKTLFLVAILANVHALPTHEGKVCKLFVHLLSLS